LAAKFVIGKNTRADEGSKQPSSRNSWNTLKPKPSRGQSFATSMTLTFALIAILMALISTLMGSAMDRIKTAVQLFGIIVIGAVAAFGSAVVVYYNTAETVSVIDCIFESCSAFGTVGLSVGVTGQLNTGAKLLYMACMFMGRVGPVSLAISLTAKPDDNKRKVLPVGHINVG